MTRILIIDDEEIIRERLKQILELDDYTVLTAENGNQGVKLFQENNPEITIVDIKMPGIDGIEVLKQIKKEDTTTDVIIITGHGGIDTAIEAMKEKAFGYIQKPIDYDELSITIRRVLEKQRIKAELLKFSHAVKHIPTAILITDLSGSIEYVNPKFCTLTGYSPEEVIGKNPKFLKSDTIPQQEYKKLWETIVSGGEWRGTFQNRKKDGSLYWVSASISPIKDAGGNTTRYIGIEEDITSKKEAEMALQNNEGLLRTITSSVNDAILMIDYDSTILFWNPAAKKIFGFSSEEVIGHKIEQFIIPERFIEQHRKRIDLFKETGLGPILNKTIEVIGKRKGGKEFPLEMSVSSLEHKGMFRAIGIIRDISERKTVEDQLKAQQQQLIQADKMSSLGTMAAGVIHEINNPLNVATGDIHLIKRDLRTFASVLTALLEIKLPSEESSKIEQLPKNEEITGMMEAIKDKLLRCGTALRRINEIVRGLKDFSRLDQQDILEIDIKESIVSTLQFIPQKYKEGIDLQINLLPDILIQCHGKQMNQVFMNIIINSLQALDNKGSLIIEAASTNKKVFITFRDTGPGIAKEKIGKIFDPFFTTKPIGIGTGLGLSISYSIVEKHSGTITARNNDDKGVTFTVTLPRESFL